jgi:DNA-binding Lrp family transcriptional regulator
MNDCQFYIWLQEVRCTTVKEVAEVLGISRKSARLRLERLTKLGVMKKKKFGRAVLYCYVAPLGYAKVAPLETGYAKKVRTRVVQVAELLAREGCIATSVLMQKLRISHTKAYYVMRLLQASGCAVEVVIGKVAVWCISRDAAQKLLSELRREVARLVGGSGLRYVTSNRLYALISSDAEARKLFGRIMRVDGKPSVSVLCTLKSLLEAVYGAPVRKSVFYATQLANGSDIDIRETDIQIANEAVNVKFRMPHEEALLLYSHARKKRTSVSAVVRSAVERLLERYRS